LIGIESDGVLIVLELNKLGVITRRCDLEERGRATVVLAIAAQSMRGALAIFRSGEVITTWLLTVFDGFTTSGS
jgi:hypothetical protein